MKPYKLIAFALALCFGIVSTLCVAFASPSITDADITFSVRGFYTQYGRSSSWTSGYYVAPNGNIFDSGEALLGYSDYIPVTPGGTVFCFYAPNSNLFNTRFTCFYDSEYNVVVGGTSSYTMFVSVPTGASYVRISQGYALSHNALIVSSPYPVDSSNYKYLFHTFEGLEFDSEGALTIPYQVYGFTQIYLDFRFFNSVYQFSNIALKVLSEYTNSSVYSGLLNYGEGQVLAEPYTLIDDDIHTSAVASSSSNPAKFAFSIPHSEFSGFLLYLPVDIPSGNVSTAVKVKVYDFQLDGEDVSARLEIDRTLDQLNDLAEQLAVPTPEIDVDNILGNAFEGTDMNNTNNFFAVFYNNDIVPKMLIIAVSIALLGYILFGKKEA